MNDLSNKYALAALKDRRAGLASEILQLERQLRHRKELLVHVDATLRLLDPSIEVGAIPTKRLRRVKLFAHGQLGRLIRDALRVANGGPLSAAEIVAHIIKEGGLGDEARRALGSRVRGNLAFLQKQGVIAKFGEQREARWRLL